MSQEPPEDEPIYEVDDSSGFVAREKKKMIIESRKRVNDIETQILVGGQSPDGTDGLGAFSHIVRQFLRNIEPLLSNSDVNGATEAYNESYLGTLTIQPPIKPRTERIPDHLETGSGNDWYKVNDDAELVLHRFSDSVDPKSFDIHGLREVIVSDGRTATWDAVIDRKKSKGFDGGGPEDMTVSESEPWNYEILHNSVRTADQFLENANIGLSLNEGEPDDGFLDL